MKQVQQVLAGILRHAEDADVSAAAPPAFDDVAVVGREAGGQHIVDLRGRTIKIFSKLVALEFDFGRFLGKHGFDKLLYCIA